MGGEHNKGRQLTCISNQKQVSTCESKVFPNKKRLLLLGVGVA